MMELSERIIEVLERNGFNINEVTKQDNEFYLEYGQSTPEGEDWWETLWFDGTEEGFIKAFIDRANSFDVDEEAEVWIEARGRVRGVPESIRDLIDDAEWKKETLLKVARELNENETENSTKVVCPNCGKEFDLLRLEHDEVNLEGFYTTCFCGASFDIDFDPSNTFITDAAKMADFKILTKREFLASYSYLTEDEYDATRLYFKWLNEDNSEPKNGNKTTVS